MNSLKEVNSTAALESVVGRLADEFTERLQRGEQPDIEDYARRYPGQEIIVRQILAAILALHSPRPLADSAQAETTTSAGGSQQEDARPPSEVALPDYEVQSELGRGGMGIVYQARHLKLKRVVALKMILAGAHAGPQDLERFRLEAEAIARLQHPNIVQIHEVGEHDGKPYFALEYVDGGSLRDKVAATPLPPDAAAKLVETLARAMQVAHEHGVIHRDLKPGNVLLTKNGTPKITDFGLAKQLDSDSGQTQTGAIVGTPSYMAPEQATGKGQAITPAVDIYALGAMLYELLTGRPPFKASSVLDTLEQVRTQEPPPPGQLQPKTPPDLETICLKCLRKDPVQRYASAGHLADDLQRFQKGEPIRARPVGQVERFARWCRRNPMVAGLSAAVILVLLTGTAVAWYLAADAMAARKRADGNAANEVVARKDADKNAALEIVARKDADKNAALEVVARKDSDKNAAIAKNNETKAIDNATETQRALDRMDIAKGLELADQGDLFQALLWFARPLQHDRGPPLEADLQCQRISAYLRFSQLPTLLFVSAYKDRLEGAKFSADGRRVVTWAVESGRVWDAATGEPLGPPLPRGDMANDEGPSGDGRRVATKMDKQRRVCDFVTGQPLTPPLKQDLPDFYLTQAKFSADRRRVVAVSRSVVGELNYYTARVWDAATGEPVSPPMKHKSLTHVAFSADGARVVTSGRDKMARMWDAATGKLLGQVLQHQGYVHFGAFSNDGRRLVTVSGDTDPYGHGNMETRVWDTATSQPLGPPLCHQGHSPRVTISGDGRRLVIATSFYDVSLNKYNSEVRVWDAAASQQLSRTLQHQDQVSHAAFSSDSRRVVTASRDQTAQVWDAATGTRLGLPLRHPVEVRHAAFGDDGRLFVTAYKQLDPRNGLTPLGNWEARIWNADTAELLNALQLRHPAEVRYAEFSANGRHVVTASKDKTARLWDVASGRPFGPALQHHDQVVHAAFSNDGRYVVTASLDKTARIWDVTTGRPMTRPLMHLHPVHCASFSADGRRIVTAGSHYDHKMSPGEARIWDVATGRQLGPPLKHPANVVHATFSPDGRRILTASHDKTAQVWSAVTGQPFGPPLRHKDQVYHAAFSADGRRVVTASKDKTARVWNATTGQPLSPPLLHQGQVYYAEFSPDGRRIVTASADNTARVWELEPDLSAADLVTLTQLLSGSRLEKYGTLVPRSPEQQEHMADLLKLLRAKHPRYFTVPPDSSFAWHRREMEACVKEKNALGVILHFHYSTPQWLLPNAGWGALPVGCLLMPDPCLSGR